MYLSDSEQKLTREEMASFNALFDNLLPQSFQDFYLENNGGYPLNNEDGNFFMLGGFIPVKYGELPIEQLYKDLTKNFGELRKMVPFAHDEGGNCFLLSLKEGDSFGEIFVFLMDEKELVSVADSFDDFIEELFG